MKHIILKTENGASIEAAVADNFLTRFRGLMFHRPLEKGTGLLLTPCASVHMLWMRFALDIIYLDASYKIIKVVPHLLPWLGLSACPKAHMALEVSSGEAARLKLAAGQSLSLCECRKVVRS